MRPLALAALASLAALATTGCATRARPYRFSSPLLGAADVPAAPLPHSTPAPRIAAVHPHSRRGWQSDAQASSIRTVSAAGIEARMPVASAEAAASVTDDGYARPAVWSMLPAPHLGALPAPTIHEPADLRALIGTRDSRDPTIILLSWLAELNIHVDAAVLTSRFQPPTEIALPGDLLVFDHAIGDEPADLLALAIARDARGVTEFLYAG